MSVECFLGPESAIANYFDIATHNGIITVENTVRGTHRTFRIKTQKEDARFAPGKRILSIMQGGKYVQIGFVKSNGGVVLWKRYQEGYYEALVRVLRNPKHFEQLGCVYHYEGTCRVCNRSLTNPESIESGIGPICAARN